MSSNDSPQTATCGTPSSKRSSRRPSAVEGAVIIVIVLVAAGLTAAFGMPLDDALLLLTGAGAVSAATLALTARSRHGIAVARLAVQQ